MLTPAIAASQSPYAPHSTPRPMQVKVKLHSGRRLAYEGLFPHTFDAYDDAMERYGLEVARIEVAVVPPMTAQVSA